MPVIDLDARPQATATHRKRHPPRLLAMSAAALLLLSLPGEAGSTPSIFDDLCGYLAATDRPRSSVVLIDTESGEIVQSTTVEANCTPHR